jgi:L-methionine (R)-S-oxide reductase
MTKAESYRWASKRVRAQVERHLDLVATLANTAAILKEYRPNFFWVGFYFFKQDHLLLGPFQGPPACVRLELNKGVCAHAATTRQSVVVANVHEFPGHVACDSRSHSEIVIPLFDRSGGLQAVLDVDSEQLNDFDDQDSQGLQEIAKLLEPAWNLTIK